MPDSTVGQRRVDRLRSAVELAILTLEALTHPDPQRGLLTNVKQRGDAQGVPLTHTYEAVLDVIAVLKEALDV